jgi:hypothetical protein
MTKETEGGVNLTQKWAVMLQGSGKIGPLMETPGEALRLRDNLRAQGEAAVVVSFAVLESSN